MSTLPKWLAKDALDIGIVTNNLEGMLAFWQGEIGLPFDHMLPLGGGLRQHRHDHAGGVFKLNHTRAPLAPREDGGYTHLYIARDDVTVPMPLTDPDGNAVTLVPMGHKGITQWAIEVTTQSRDAFMAFYHGALGLPVAGNHPAAVHCGRSLIIGRIDPDAPLTASDPMAHAGYRYTTLQVDKVDTVHAAVLAAGGREGRAPATLGKTARISFVCDGGGNWMELSQRASITGSLAP